MGKEKERRKHIFRHRPYLESIADRIVQTSPTRDIVFNSLLAVYEVAYSEGYITRIEDSKHFKAKREEHRKASWDRIMNHIDDLIHERPIKNQKSK